MSWHSKRHNIKHKKAISDAKKSKVYAKIGKLIEIAARGWADPSMNPALDTVLLKAKANSLPKEIIDKAIKKWSWGWSEGDLQEIFYEAYGPSGSALYIKCVTNNTNRSASNTKALINKYGGSLGTPWSVGRQFKELGIITIDGISFDKIAKGKTETILTPFDAPTLELDILETNALDCSLEDDVAIITTTREDLLSVSKYLESQWYHIAEAELQFVADNQVELDSSDTVIFEKLLEVLEDDDDVDQVYHNVA